MTTNNRLIDQTKIDLIDTIVKRLKHVVGHLQIRNWLEQFDYSEWDLALKVLNGLEYFDENDLFQLFDTGLKDIHKKINDFERAWEISLKTAPGDSKIKQVEKRNARNLRRKGHNEVQILPLGNNGKSGSHMLYYILHAPFFKKSNFQILDNKEKIIVNNFDNFLHLILVDDFLGSGDSAYKYINNEIYPILDELGVHKVRIYLLCSFFMEGAKKNITKNAYYNTIQIIGTPRIPAFSPTGSPFGYRPSMVKVREFCYKYGKGLYKVTDYDAKSPITTDYPLGYKNTQSLIVFAHTVPNNTLPIFWSIAKGWNPLFPRVIFARLKDKVNLNKESRIWISMANKLGRFSFFKKNTYSDKNIKLICYIRLLKMGTVGTVISQKIGISLFEMEEIIEDGISRKILKNHRTLTNKGQAMYDLVMRKRPRISSGSTVMKDDIVYIPKVFRGRT
ncbi:phosphoribosyltransferase-like protein [Chitinophaga filiformis]|uniref:Uncharacterized protein n=1 Tax=Chitinophaga filiformis TaxID=104663 RepID=A0A1G8EA59_CHIFI|nr:hypothetical protein [Chitinophaga filiformis]SDH66798.1 hypothetical protein SAMN04488121_11753 [Chitinophaga filiformis]